MAAVVTIVVKGGSALRDMQGVERQVQSTSATELKAAAAGEKAAMKQVAAEQKKLDAAKKAADKSAAAQTKAATKAAAEKAKADKKAADDAVQASNTELQARLRNVDRLRRERDRAEDAATKTAAREAAKRAKEEEQTIASRRKAAADTLRRAGGIAGGLLAGGVAAGVSAMGTARGVAGVQDAATRVQQGNVFREKLLITANQAGMGERADEIQQKILSVAKARAKDPLEILAGLQRGHEEFNALSMFVDKLDDVAKAAKATDSEFGDFVGMMGNMRRAFQLTDKDFADAMNIVAAGAATGSVSLGNFARDFPAAAGIFATNTGQRGIEGVRQFAALSQTVATGGFGSSESATRVERFSADLNDVKVRQGLRGIGIKLPKEGAPMDLSSLIDQLAKNKQFGRAGVRQDIFKETRSLQAVESLLSARKAVANGQAGAVDFASQKTVSARLGSADIDKAFGALESGGLIEIQRKAIDMQADTITNLKKYNDQVVTLVEASNQLEKAFGTLGLWASSIGVGGLAAGGASVAGRFLGSAPGAAAATGAVGGAAGGAGILATLGTGVAAASGLAIASTIGAGAAIGSGVGYGFNKGTELVTGRSISDRFADVLASWDPFNIKGDMSVAKVPALTQAKSIVDVQVELTDKRTLVKATPRDRGAKTNTAAGPSMAGNGQ